MNIDCITEEFSIRENCALSLNDLFPRFVASQTAKANGR